jgi:hypothetical protein
LCLVAYFSCTGHTCWLLAEFQFALPHRLIPAAGASDNLGRVVGSAAASMGTAAVPTASASSAKYPYPSNSGRMQKALDKHNTYRAKHGAGPLNWDNQLAASAAASAARCKTKSRSDYSTSKAGENVYYTSMSGDPIRLLTKAIDSWYQESSMYDFDKPGFSATTSRFTQVVWKSTTRLGCAVQDCSRYYKRGGQRGTLIVCHYSPSGNEPGKHSDNVASVGVISPPSSTNTLAMGQSLASGDCLLSSNQRFRFCMQVRPGHLGLTDCIC